MTDRERPADSGIPTPVVKQEGVTSAERYLAELCRRSFLSLWSYSAVYRNQGKVGAGDGKEVADHLVVFEDDIIIFSDKDIEWNPDKPVEVAWNRWYRRAIIAGAKQLRGAERWIRDFSDRLYLDRSCTVRFPIQLPDASRARVHLVLVAHGSSKACREWHGGYGSLMFSTLPEISTETPFTVGDLDTSRTFVHVLDDMTLDVVMRHCDTIADFTEYLVRKERFVRSGIMVAAAGEEELLAHYLTEVDETGQHAFVVPADISGALFDEGSYADYLRNPQTQAKERADEPSYLWDELIEKFSHNVLNGTLYHQSGTGVAHHEPGLRQLAREPRVRRRMLAKTLIDMATSTRGDPRRRVRIAAPTRTGDPHIVLLLLRCPDGMSYDDYRIVRRELLFNYMRTVCLIDPSAGNVVGLAMDFPSPAPASEDLLLIDGQALTRDERHDAEQRRVEFSLLMEVREFRSMESEYPKPFSSGTTIFSGSLHRNAGCPCGSGKKYRLCCRRQSPFSKK